MPAFLFRCSRSSQLSGLKPSEVRTVSRHSLQKTPHAWGITGARIDLPHDLSIRSGFNCDRIKKLLRHEIGHVLGLQHPEDGVTLWQIRFPRWVPSIMHRGTNDPYTGIDDLPLNPTCGDINAAKESKNQEGPSRPDVGDAGGIVDCGPNSWTDSHGCCHPIETWAYAPEVGHLNRKPTSAIEYPPNNSSYVFGASITFNVHTMDSDGSVYRVDYIVKPVGGAQFTVSGGAYPFSITSSGLTPGAYDVEAVAYDTAQQYTVSAPVRINVAPPPSATEVLASGGILYPSQYRTSANGLYSVIYQSDGNLVLYGPGWVPIVWTATAGNGATYMNPSGNLEVYNSLNPLVLGWQSLTGNSGNANSYLWVKNEGRIALIRPNGSQIVQWP